MPEGDTIHRSAARLHAALQGLTLLSVVGSRACSAPPELPGSRVEGVQALGKHLLFEFSGGWYLHSHMGMTGAWHLYPLGVTWQKPVHYAAVTLGFDDREAVCFTPKQIAFLTETERRRQPWLRSLGPDLLDATASTEVMLGRLRLDAQQPLGVALLDQRLAAGVGNVYKSEGLFLQGLDPFAPVAAFTEDELAQLLEHLRRLMRRNLDGRPRTTRFRADGPRQWVYRREGEACLRCGARIQMRRQGDLGRSTYWCPQCQPRRVSA